MTHRLVPDREFSGAHALRATAITALVLLSGPLSAQSKADVKDPHPIPPHAEDIKTQAPASVEMTLAAGETPPVHPTSPSRRAPNAKLPPALSHLPSIDRNRLYYQQENDALWVHGRTWKASFASDAATFIPFFGSKAPQNYPIAFTVESAHRGSAEIALSRSNAAQRTDDRIDIDRAGLDERYDLTPDQVEQSFVFTSLPQSTGDLVVRLHVDTELDAHTVADGIDFTNELGRVHYGGAKVVDAAGREQMLEAALTDGRIELRVPQAFLGQASYPLTLDPVLLVFALDHTTFNDFAPDIAYDATTDSYIMVYEEEVSSTDHDVYAYIVNGSTSPVAANYIDMTTQSWVEPSVADNAFNSEFLAVASVHINASTNWRIYGRTIDAATLTESAAFQISETISYDMFHAVVGGDGTFAPPVYYMVVWQRNFSPSDNDIFGRLVAPGGTNVGSTIYIDNTSNTLDFLPKISKSDGASPSATQEWSVVWSRVKTANDWDVYGAQLFWNGAITAGPYAIDTSTNDDRDVRVSSVLDGDPTGVLARPHMLTLTRNNDIVYSVWRGANYMTSGYLANLEQDQLQSEVQWGAAVESDGHKFAIAYAESYQGTADMDTWVTTVELAGAQVVPTDIHQSLGYTSNIESNPAIASRHTGGGGEWDFWVVWQTLVPPSYSGDIDVGIYTAPVFTTICNPGTNAIACPCSNAPLFGYGGCNNSANTGGAVLSGVGAASTDTVVLTASGLLPHALAIFLQGTSYVGWQSGVAFGDGIRCVGGTLLRLATKSAVNGTASFPEGNDGSIRQTAAAHGATIDSGTQRFYQTYYRDPANYACGGSATFNITSGVVIDW